MPVLCTKFWKKSISVFLIQKPSTGLELLTRSFPLKWERYIQCMYFTYIEPKVWLPFFSASYCARKVSLRNLRGGEGKKKRVLYQLLCHVRVCCMKEISKEERNVGVQSSLRTLDSTIERVVFLTTILFPSWFRGEVFRDVYIFSFSVIHFMVCLLGDKLRNG